MRRKKLLFICLGNICRSPAAHGIMQQMVDERGLAAGFEIASAGIGAWHVGNLPDSRMRSHGHSHGYTFDHHARQICDADLDRFDYVIVMDEENYKAVSRIKERTGGRAEVCRMADYFTRHPKNDSVPDPYYGGDADFELAIELIEDGCEGLLSHLTTEREACTD